MLGKNRVWLRTVTPRMGVADPSQQGLRYKGGDLAMIGRPPGDSKAETTGTWRRQKAMMSEFSSTERVNVSVAGYAGRLLPRPWRCAMQCLGCHERFENGGHWCIPYPPALAESSRSSWPVSIQ